MQEIMENNTNITVGELSHDSAIPSVCEIDDDNLATIKLFMKEEELIRWLKEKMTGKQDK